MKWHDLSLPVSDNMPVYPGDPAVSADRVLEHGRDGIQLSLLRMGSHTGTHLDAPRHFLAEGAAIDDLPVERFCRPARVIACPPDRDGKISLSGLDGSDFQPGEALLLSTGWEKYWGQPNYFQDCPVFAAGSSRILLSLGISLLGVDLPTVQEAGESSKPAMMHISLLGGGIILVENLTNLQAVTGQKIEFYAFPLKLAGGDGSPVRAVARVVDF